MNLSPQQAAVCEAVSDTNDSILVESVAGSGKTTLGINTLTRMEGLSFFGAYNKKIADEIQRKVNELVLPTNTKVSTMHGLGLRTWGRVARNVTIDDNKCLNIFRDMAKVDAGMHMYRGAVLSLVSLAKQAGIGIDELHSMNDKLAWKNLVEHFSVDTAGADDQVLNLARRVLMKSNEMCYDVIDFNDMVYAPLAFNARMFQHDWVVIDEAQDTNATRRLLALRTRRNAGRVLAIGDPHQAIYGFTGADADSLDRIGKATNAVRMPLTVSFRCPQSVVAVAQEYVSHIRSAPEAPEGTVETLEYDDLEDVLQVGDMVVCRFNGPLVALAYNLIGQGIPAVVAGRQEVAKTLSALARRFKAATFGDFVSALDTYAITEPARLRLMDHDSRAVMVEDAAECLQVITDRVIRNSTHSQEPAEQVVAEIYTIFGEEGTSRPHVSLSSIHKAKGLENKRVFWLQTGPCKWAKKDWEKEQEINLMYVAATRSQDYLGLVSPKPRKPVEN